MSKMMQDIAHIFVSQVAAEIGLDYTEESIKQVDRLLELVRRPEQGVDETLVLSAGAYLGETVCRALGGAWVVNDAEIADSSVIVNGCELWPFRRVRQRLHYGTQRPLYAWFEMAKAAATAEIQMLLQGQEHATMIRPTGHDPLVIQVSKIKHEKE